MLSLKELLKLVKDLIRSARRRAELNLFVIEGQKVVADFLSTEAQFRYLIFDEKRLFTDSILQRIKEQADARNIPVVEITPSRFTTLSDVCTPQGVLAVVAKQHYELSDILQRSSFRLVIGESIQDPANIGTIVRNCIAFEYDALILTEGSVDVYNPKAVRVAASYLFNVPVFYLSYEEIAALKSSGTQFYCSDLGADTSIAQCTPATRLAIIIGNEGQGISKEFRTLSDTTFIIPISDRIDSLNVSAAAAIIMYHFSRFFCESN